VIPVDAYSRYLIDLSEARLRDLRREAEEHGLSRAARAGRGSWWSRARARLRRPAMPDAGKRPTLRGVVPHMTVRAEWNDTVLAESDDTVVVEGNHYFPKEAIRQELFEEVPTTSFCPWKGTASYYDVVVDGARNAGAAWYYPEPMDAASHIRDRVAFWKGVRVVQE
jgi:uncharacterized protein (DUF427 family)